MACVAVAANYYLHRFCFIYFSHSSFWLDLYLLGGLLCKTFQTYRTEKIGIIYRINFFSEVGGSWSVAIMVIL